MCYTVTRYQGWNCADKRIGPFALIHLYAPEWFDPEWFAPEWFAPEWFAPEWFAMGYVGL